MFMASLAGLIALPLMLLSVLLPVALVASLRVWLYKRRSRLLGLILLSITAFTRVGASKVDHDAHGIVVEEHHAEHWAALSGAEPGHFPGVCDRTACRRRLFDKLSNV